MWRCVNMQSLKPVIVNETLYSLDEVPENLFILFLVGTNVLLRRRPTLKVIQ